MKVAILAPIPHLEAFCTTDYHLVLSHLVHQDPEYAEFYKRQSSHSYIILDNSAHEFGKETDGERLLEAAELCGAHEIVLPDRLFFGRDTLRKSTAGYKYLSDVVLLGTNFLVVPQGRTLKEWRECLRGLLELSTTVGLSKDYETWPGGLPRLAKIIMKEGGRQIHLLGCPRSVGQLLKLRRLPGVRGTDSAKPLVLASQGQVFPSSKDIRKDTELDYVGRKGDYFHDTISTAYLPFASCNTFRYRRLCEDPTL